MTEAEAFLAIAAGIGLGVLFSEDRYHLRVVALLGAIAVAVWFLVVLI